MAWRNDHLPISVRFQQTYTLDFDGRKYLFQQDIDSLTTVYDAVPFNQSVVLGTYLVQRYRDTIRGKSVLELGAGAGLPSILLANCSAQKVTTTDLPSVLPPLQASITANCGPNIEAVAYAWGAPADRLNPPFDIVIASDVVYDFDYFPHFVASLGMVCTLQTEVFVCYKERYGDVERWFFEELQGKFAWEEVGQRCEPFVASKVRIYQLTKLS